MRALCVIDTQGLLVSGRRMDNPDGETESLEI